MVRSLFPPARSQQRTEGAVAVIQSCADAWTWRSRAIALCCRDALHRSALPSRGTAPAADWRLPYWCHCARQERCACLKSMPREVTARPIGKVATPGQVCDRRRNRLRTCGGARAGERAQPRSLPSSCNTATAPVLLGFRSHSAATRPATAAATPPATQQPSGAAALLILWIEVFFFGNDRIDPFDPVFRSSPQNEPDRCPAGSVW
jgi:hypothetical protein